MSYIKSNLVAALTILLPMHVLAREITPSCAIPFSNLSLQQGKYVEVFKNSNFTVWHRTKNNLHDFFVTSSVDPDQKIIAFMKAELRDDSAIWVEEYAKENKSIPAQAIDLLFQQAAKHVGNNRVSVFKGIAGGTFNEQGILLNRNLLSFREAFEISTAPTPIQNFISRYKKDIKDIQNKLIQRGANPEDLKLHEREFYAEIEEKYMNEIDQLRISSPEIFIQLAQRVQKSEANMPFSRGGIPICNKFPPSQVPTKCIANAIKNLNHETAQDAIMVVDRSEMLGIPEGSVATPKLPSRQIAIIDEKKILEQLVKNKFPAHYKATYKFYVDKYNKYAQEMGRELTKNEKDTLESYAIAIKKWMANQLKTSLPGMTTDRAKETAEKLFEKFEREI